MSFSFNQNLVNLATSFIEVRQSLTVQGEREINNVHAKSVTVSEDTFISRLSVLILHFHLCCVNLKSC